MKVTINRDVCDASLSFCEQCLGKFLKEPQGYERRCFEVLEEDGSDLLHIELHTGGDVKHLALDDAQRKMMAGEGWSTLVGFDVPIYRDDT